MFAMKPSDTPDVIMDFTATPNEAKMAKHQTKEGYAVMRSKREADEYAARTGKVFDKAAVMEQPYMRNISEKDRRILNRSVGK